MEIWDIYDKDRNRTGRTAVRGDGMADGDYHLVADIWIMNTKGEVLVQKRSMEKETGPGLWCCTGGAAIAGEDSAQAFAREMTEELGVAPEMEHAEIAFSHTRRNCHKDIWFVRQDIPQCAFHLQKEEVEAVRWVTLAQLEQEASNATTWWRLSYLDTLLDYLKTKEQAGDD